MRLLTACLMFVLAGCGADAMEPEPEALGPALAGIDSIARETALLLPLAEAAGAGTSGAESAMRAAATAELFFAPVRCVSANAVGASVRYQFDRCAGLLGLSGVSGTMDAIFVAVGTTRPSATCHALRLRANGATIDLDISVDFSFSEPGAVSLAVRSTASGVGALGARFDRRGEHSLRWEPSTRCMTVNGQWVAAGGYTTTLTSFRRCARRCPEPGGAVRLVRPAQQYSLTLNFPGGSTGLWQSMRGAHRAMGTFAMECQN